MTRPGPVPPGRVLPPPGFRPPGFRPPPPGRWLVAVSGGSDSVAACLWCQHLPGVQLVVAHYNHAQRQAASDEDEAFVRALAGAAGLPFVSGRLRPASMTDVGTNPLRRNRSARLRAARFDFLAEAAAAEGCRGVVLGHHQDDQAETLLLRLQRGGSLLGLCGMARHTRRGSLDLFRPLLALPKAAVVDLLMSQGQTWREDASNTHRQYARNVARRLLTDRPTLKTPLLELARRSRAWRRWLEAAGGPLPETFAVGLLADLPKPAAVFAARRWLLAHGVPGEAMSDAVAARLVQQAADAATPAQLAYPGGVRVCRRRGVVRAEQKAGLRPQDRSG